MLFTPCARIREKRCPGSAQFGITGSSARCSQTLEERPFAEAEILVVMCVYLAPGTQPPFATRAAAASNPVPLNRGWLVPGDSYSALCTLLDGHKDKDGAAEGVLLDSRHAMYLVAGGVSVLSLWMRRELPITSRIWSSPCLVFAHCDEGLPYEPLWMSKEFRLRDEVILGVWPRKDATILATICV